MTTTKTPSRPLWAITADLLAVQDAADEGGEIDDRLLAFLADTEQEEGVKIDNYLNLMKKWESERLAAEMEANYYQAMADNRTRSIDRLKKNLLQHMQATGQPRLESATGRKIRVQQNPQQPVIVADWVDVKQLPEEFQRVKTTVELNKDKVKAYLTGWIPLPKVGDREEPFASLGDRGFHLRFS